MIGALLVLGLPNSTSCTEEKDQLYQYFKIKTKRKANEIFQDKVKKVVTCSKNCVIKLNVRLKKGRSVRNIFEWV